MLIHFSVFFSCVYLALFWCWYNFSAWSSFFTTLFLILVYNVCNCKSLLYCWYQTLACMSCQGRCALESYKTKLNKRKKVFTTTTRNINYRTKKVGFTNSKIVFIVDLSLFLKTKMLLSVFPLFMTNMLSFLWTRLPTISCLHVNHITSNA